jgi:hypothetical protein
VSEASALLHLEENSSITATNENNGDGGNVTIGTTALLARKRGYESITNTPR